MSGIIPKEQLAAYQRWQFDAFDAPPAAAPEPEPSPAPPEELPLDAGEPVPPPPALPTAEDIERIHEEARQAGYAAGFAEGQAAGEAAVREAGQTLVEELIALVQGMESALAELDQQVAESVLGVGLEIARQLALGSLQANPDYLLPIVRDALAALPLQHAHVQLHLHPADAANVRPHLETLGAGTPLQVIEDAGISRGGCRLRAGPSEIDATLETRWQRILDTIGAQPEPWLKRP